MFTGNRRCTMLCRHRSQQKVGAYPEGVGMVRAASSGGMGLAEAGYTQMAYDSAGRQVYYTTAPGGMVPPYQTVTAASVDGRQTGALNQEALQLYVAVVSLMSVAATPPSFS
ncbi:hypothetical protein HHK36_009649 [Tetracentron sinense]|uniref:Uncharacterized protein n=1 Tax=Tetracentron sinense TaxID=13715 RepID=A0A834ZFL6_TETSI|nr:hypothetical protein HHK36_009649 [Tetracentron sinense]